MASSKMFYNCCQFGGSRNSKDELYGQYQKNCKVNPGIYNLQEFKAKDLLVINMNTFNKVSIFNVEFYL